MKNHVFVGQAQFYNVNRLPVQNNFVRFCFWVIDVILLVFNFLSVVYIMLLQFDIFITYFNLSMKNFDFIYNCIFYVNEIWGSADFVPYSQNYVGARLNFDLFFISMYMRCEAIMFSPVSCCIYLNVLVCCETKGAHRVTWSSSVHYYA